MALRALWDVTQQFQNKNGSNLTSGKIYIYYQGRTALATTYHDEDGTVVNSNPVLLDNNGRATAFADPIYSYTIVVCDYYGKELFSQDITLHDAISTAEDVVVIGTDGTVLVDRTELPNGVQYDLSVNTDIIATKEDVSDLENEINDKLDDKKDKQTALTFTGAATKTVTNISQDANGIITVTYDDIDLPPEVPNVEITSPNGTIDVQSSTDVQTNTKTFTIDVNAGGVEWFTGTDVDEHFVNNNSTVYGFTKIDGNIDLAGYYGHTLPLKESVPYLVIEEVDLTTIDTFNEYRDVKVTMFNMGISHTSEVSATVRLDNTNNYTQTVTIAGILFGGPTGYSEDYYHEAYAAVANKFVGSDIPGNLRSVKFKVNKIAVYKLAGLIAGGGGLDKVYHDTTLSGDGTEDSPLSVTIPSSTYTAGDAIDITNNTISVKYNNYNDNQGNYFVDFGGSFGIADSELSINSDNELLNTVTWLNVKLPTILAGDGVELTDSTLPSGVKAKTIDVKVGNGLEIDEDNNVIKLDSVTEEVVETVEKLKDDLDTQITVNFDMPNISQAYDFANPSVSTMANGACMLCQAFTIPINHEIRTVTDDADTPTLLGIYAQQNFAHKIMLALYEYTYAAEGEEHGSSTYVGDTGPVTVVQGVNEYPLKNRNPSITELRSDKVYYATLYLPSTALVNGLLLAGAPNYGNASIPAEPRLTCGVDNITWDGSELDMSDPTTTLNHYQEVIIPGEPTYYQYYIGPWNSGYNERWTAPRFYMQIRNGEFNVPVVPTTPFNDLGDALPRGTLTQTDIPSFTPSQSNSAFRDVTPLLNVTITAFEWIDGMQNAAGWAAANCVYDSGFANNLSGVSNSVVDLGQVVTGSNPGYAHRITFTTPLTLTAGTTYRFLCGCTDGSPYFKVWLDPTNVIYFGNNGWYIDISNLTRDDHHAGMYNKLYDNQNNHYVI